MRRLLLAATILLGVVACSDLTGDEEGGGTAGGGAGGGADACPEACAWLAECDPRLADSSCVDLCHEASYGGDLTQACLTCWTSSSCGVLDGSDPACDRECGRDCGSDADCLPETGQLCDVSEYECQLPCATDADCDGQLCCADGDFPGCKNECWGSCSSDLDCDTEYGEGCLDPEGDGSRSCNCACNLTDGACDPLSAAEPGTPCHCDFDCG